MALNSLTYEEICDDFYSQPLKAIRGGGVRKITYDCSINRKAGRWLYDAITTRKPERVLEIGLAWGGSAIHIGAALRDNGRGMHVVLDPFQDLTWSYIGATELRRLGLDQRPESENGFELIERRSDTAMPEMWERGDTFQFIFIDGDHSFHGVFVDVYYAEKLLEVGGMIVFDDAMSLPILKVRSYMAANMPHLKFLGEEDGRFAFYEKVGEDERSHSSVNDF